MIHCPTPPVENLVKSCTGARKKRQAQNTIVIGFEMDNVTSVQHTDHSLEYVDNPVYYNLSAETPFKPEKLLYITVGTSREHSKYQEACEGSCMKGEEWWLTLIISLEQFVQGFIIFFSHVDNFVSMA